MSNDRENIKVTMHARVECNFFETGYDYGHSRHWKLIEGATQDELKAQVPAFWHIEKQWESFEPATIISYGADGHKYEYNIIGFYLDGAVRTSSWDARHQDDCPCRNPEEWF